MKNKQIEHFYDLLKEMSLSMLENAEKTLYSP